MSDSEGEDGLDMFNEPEGFYKAEPEPTSAVHQLRDGRELTLHLVGHNPLWGHLLWNAGRTLAHYLEDHAAELIVGKTVLELGAGAGLPSLVSAIKGARKVVVTDYPDADLIDNLRQNVRDCSLVPSSTVIHVDGYLWGASVESLLSNLGSDQSGFDLLILADLLFNHSEHTKLIKTVQQTIKRHTDALALVFFTPYRPWLLEKDLAFFELAEAGGFTVEKFFEHVMEKVMFDEDPGVSLLPRFLPHSTDREAGRAVETDRIWVPTSMVISAIDINLTQSCLFTTTQPKTPPGNSTFLASSIYDHPE